MSAVRVKPLEWKRYDDGWWEASSIFGDYIIREHYPDWLSPHGTWVDVSDIDAAKAAAQADYEARIMSALLPAQTEPDAGRVEGIPAPRGGLEPNWWEEWVKTTRAYNALAKAAQAVIDETKAIHDNDPWPIRYRAPYEAITKLGEALAKTDRAVALTPPSPPREEID